MVRFRRVCTCAHWQKPKLSFFIVYCIHICERIRDPKLWNFSLFNLNVDFFSICNKTVSDQLKNSRLASSSSSQLKHLLSSSLPSSGHHQDPLEAALLAAARSQHGAGIPGNVSSLLWNKRPPKSCHRNLVDTIYLWGKIVFVYPVFWQVFSIVWIHSSFNLTIF